MRLNAQGELGLAKAAGRIRPARECLIKINAPAHQNDAQKGGRASK